MKRVKLLSAILAASCCWAACSGHSSATATHDTASANSATTETSSSGNASFSVVIDGTPVSGGSIDDLQLQNTAFTYPPQNGKPQTVLFDLLSNKKDEDFYSFRFSLPDKAGTYQATRGNYDQTHSSVRLDFNLKSANNFSIYNEESLTVTIDNISSSRISGTFSGTMRLSDDSRGKDYKNSVTVTDGKFDIPFSTGNIRPE